MAGEKPVKARRLTEMSHCAGCAAKLKAGDLARVLGGLKTAAPPQALVGFTTSDDAAVYQLAPGLAVVETVDFFPPLVDDPFQFGAIAAANSLSDIWAMGGKPLFALNLVCFPEELPLKVLQKILAGGQSKADEAGIPILGGHSIRDPEPKYGMAVTAFKVNALTDVTGFGLLGHLLEMMTGSKTKAALDLERIPLIAEVPGLAEDGVVPGGTKTNLAHVKPKVRFPEGLPEHIQWLLADAQTNGGLLASVPARHALNAVQALEKAGVDAALIGEVQAGRPGIDVVG
ncbi:MAG: selenide, water dikinase SelD [Myxococcaceae bacterium]|nr:MAG: selenide, water dikinase SelD [Myxococcaceae bacterium]